MRINTFLVQILILTVAGGFVNFSTGTQLDQSAGKLTFADEVAFLKQHVEVIELSDPTGQSRVAVVPAYEGRVMTSTSGGAGGMSYGWINRELVASGKKQPHINVYGGEDRFWIGPEGGQFSVFFAKGVSFDLEHWFTPAPIDTEPFELVRAGRSQALFKSRFRLVNYAGYEFEVEVNRNIRLLSRAAVWSRLGAAEQQGVRLVGFESENTLRNAGSRTWSKATGLLSIWILGMFNASPASTIVVPFNPGSEAELGPVVNDAYFGKVPPSRLKIGKGVLFFSADANYRSKIGLSPARSKGVLGSYDARNEVLTIIKFTQPPGAREYVNSMWEIQKEPFGGDAANSYNDGPPSPGAKQLGRFYELESSSPALALAPNQSAGHVQRTFHLQGPEAALDAVARAVLGVGLNDIRNGLK